MEKEKVFLVKTSGLLKAYNEGCPDVKKVLTNLFGTEWLTPITNYKIGIKFKYGSAESIYILSQTGLGFNQKSLVTLISINDGNRWCEPREVRDCNNITNEEFSKITNGSPQLFTPVKEFYYQIKL